MQNENSSVLRRFLAVGIIIAMAFSLVIAQLLKLQVREADQFTAQSESSKRGTQSLTGMRGKIIDINGLPLAYDQKSYDITFYRNPAHTSDAYRAEYTQGIIKMIETVERNGGSTIGGFALVLEDGVYRLNFGTENPTVYALREKLWRDNMQLPADKNPVETLYEVLRKRYGIDPEMPFADAAKILAVWQESRMVAYKLEGAKVARNVSIKTVAEVTARSAEMPGIDVAESSVRVYPRGNMASHIVGYVGRIAEEDRASYLEKQYSLDDFVGRTGIEYSMEEYLTGSSGSRRGVREVEVNNRNVITRELSVIPPQDGDNVRLTLDLNLQLVTETALKNSVSTIRKEQETELERLAAKEPEVLAEIEAIIEERGYGLRLCEAGSAIVMDIKTGKVLAMASEPGFDPGLFATGISNDDFKQLLNDSRKPLFHRAVAAKYTPGSIFKMVPALAGLVEPDIDLNHLIDCQYSYEAHTISGQAPHCWIRKSQRGIKHQDQSVIEGIKNSCNYYFFQVADQLGVDRLYNWATRLGLTTSTNIEFGGEITSVVGNPQMKYDPGRPYNQQATWQPTIIRNAVRRIIEAAGLSMGIEAYDEERLGRALDQILLLVAGEQSQQGAGIRRILLEEMNLPNSTISSRNMVNEIYQYLNDLRWLPNDTLWDSVGQSITTVTPIALARYTSAIANGGTVYDAQIVDAVLGADGSMVMKKEPVVYNDLTQYAAEFVLIREGMRGVVLDEDGTSYKYFENFKYRDDIGGKTGTAQVSKIEVENNGSFVCFAPYDDPEIAIVVVMEHGFQGGLAAVAARDIVGYYLDRKAEPPTDDIARPYTYTR